MTAQVKRISHAANNMGTITKSAVFNVSSPISSRTGKPVAHGSRNSNQLKLFSAAFGFQRVHFLGFALLSALLLAVVFILPSMITPPDPATLAKPQQDSAKAEAPPDSPWQDAQLAKQRREAQETLSKILVIQNELEDKKVMLWGAEAFEQAMQTAAAGDTEYRARNFDQAQQNYRDSFKQFETLQQQVESVFAEQMAMGRDSVEQNKPRQALDSYQLALYLKPDNLEAQRGLGRAQTLEQVMELIADGKHLMKIQSFTDAGEKFKQALALDKDSKDAQQNLALARQAIKDENFAIAMSDGFTAINQKEYSKAITAFNQALKIRPNAEDAKQALSEAKNGELLSGISALNTQAQNLEAQEKWHEALKQYQKMLDLDKSLIQAKIGSLRTEARAKLDDNLQKALENPERLTNAGVYAQARQTLLDAKKIKQPGTRLNSQIERLDNLVAQLQKPVAVKIKSDNQTKVTLYKVGELGIFNAKVMDLKPGKYTVVGTREGFRDVRREFTLMPSNEQTTIVVQCEERITNG